MAKRAKQQAFGGKGFSQPNTSFGGKLLNGNNPKCKRPLESKLPLHLVLRAVQGGMRLPKIYGVIQTIVETTAHKHGVTIYKFANVGNHLHLLMKISHVRRWAAFIRELTGRIAQLMKELGLASKDKKFWLYRPFTRVIKGWQTAFKTIKEYVYLNQLEALGHISRNETKTLKDLRAIWADG